MNTHRGFASDNNAGVHPLILEEMNKVNEGHVIAYGDDPFTATAKQQFKSIFGHDIEVYFLLTGTGANVLGIQSITKSYHSIICAESSHMNIDECGAPEKFTGCKLLPVDAPDGKLTLDGIKKHMHGIGFEHHSQPKVISLTQASELGTVYRKDEIKNITDYAHKQGLFVHMDGARLCNAAATLGVGLKEITVDVGIDVLSFGGTKNGMMYGEAIIFFGSCISEDFRYIRKQGMQLVSKMRYVAAQFNAFFKDHLWLKNALHANAMAKTLYENIKSYTKIYITQKVESNAVFAILPKEVIPLVQNDYFFYVWNETIGEVRFMTSFDTTEEDIHKFSKVLGKYLN